jgi:16S rRNA (adenine1518-N6/adenine1519-N6)-dimethyltransferase
MDRLRRHGIQAKKSLGQHFLIDPSIADRIVEAAAIDSDDTVIEIGPGPGILTGRLAERAKHVLAVELDGRFVDLLRTDFADAANLDLIQADFLDTDPSQLMAGAPYLVVANLPYYITSMVLRHMLECTPQPTRAVVMVQREVAHRICANPGDLSVLGVGVQYYADPTFLFDVASASFHPRPAVESAVLRLVTRTQSPSPSVDPADYFRVVRAGFSQKRKQLGNSLSAGLALPKKRVALALVAANVDPSRRAETLSLEEWGAVTSCILRPTSIPSAQL